MKVLENKELWVKLCIGCGCILPFKAICLVCKENPSENWFDPDKEEGNE